MKRRTEWDFELGGKLDRLADLNYTACGRIVPETLEMENENGWKRLDEHLLTRIAQAGWATLHGLRLGGAHEGVLNGEHRIRL
jgi:hypothetical protein